MARSVLRLLGGMGLAGAMIVGSGSVATGAEIDLGFAVIWVPDLAPVPVPVPMGSEAAALPQLPYPLHWDRPAPPAAHLPQPVDPFGGRTVALNCGTEPEKMPATVVIACGDGNGQFQNVRWTSWRDDVAEATADKVWVECIPACYNGTIRRKPVRIVLHDVRLTPAGPAFRNLTSHDDRGARTTTLPGFEFGGEWIFP